MFKLSFYLEIVLLGVLSGIAPKYDTRIVRKSITMRYYFNESVHLFYFLELSQQEKFNEYPQYVSMRK